MLGRCRWESSEKVSYEKTFLLLERRGAAGVWRVRGGEVRARYGRVRRSTKKVRAVDDGRVTLSSVVREREKVTSFGILPARSAAELFLYN